MVIRQYTPMAPTLVRAPLSPARLDLRGEGRRLPRAGLQERRLRPPGEPQRRRPHPPLPGRRGRIRGAQALDAEPCGSTVSGETCIKHVVAGVGDQDKTRSRFTLMTPHVLSSVLPTIGPVGLAQPGVQTSWHLAQSLRVRRHDACPRALYG